MPFSWAVKDWEGSNVQVWQLGWGMLPHVGHAEMQAQKPFALAGRTPGPLTVLFG